MVVIQKQYLISCYWHCSDIIHLQLPSYEDMHSTNSPFVLRVTDLISEYVLIEWDKSSLSLRSSKPLML